MRVTWEDAAAFCNWLSGQEGLPEAYAATPDGGFALVAPVNNGYRLPTEAEWEFVARAASTGKPLKFPWGTELPVVSGTANFAGSEAASLLGASLEGHRDEFIGTSAPRAVCAQPAWLYDFAGNASEWANDRYSSFIASAAVTDPLGPAEGKEHTYRGSNWRSGEHLGIAFPRGAKAPRRRVMSSVSVSRDMWRRTRSGVSISCVTSYSAFSPSVWPRSPP